MRPAYRDALRQMRSIAQNYRLKRLCPICDEVAFVKYDKPMYYVQCHSCGYETDPLLTKIGAIRSWEREPFSGGGWKALLEFECCNTKAEMTCTGPDPRRHLSNQQVQVKCQICQKVEVTTHLRNVRSFSILSEKGNSS